MGELPGDGDKIDPCCFESELDVAGHFDDLRERYEVDACRYTC